MSWEYKHNRIVALDALSQGLVDDLVHLVREFSDLVTEYSTEDAEANLNSRQRDLMYRVLDKREVH